jgi:hypothetical protein
MAQRQRILRLDRQHPLGRRAGGILIGLGLLLLPGSRAGADNIRLTISSSTISFPNADPSVSPINAQENPILVTVSGNGNGNWVLTVLASGDMVSGTDSFPISNVRWTASGTGFFAGTMSKSSSQAVAFSTLSALPAVGTLNFRLNNQWSFPTGSYSQVITFTAATF